MKIVIRSLALLAAFSFISKPAYAAANEIIPNLLANYEPFDLNRKCRVEFNAEDSIIRIIGSETRASVALKIERVESMSEDLIVGYYSSYDGTGNAYFIRKPDTGTLVVTLLWENGELGSNQSSFCELEPKLLP